MLQNSKTTNGGKMAKVKRWYILANELVGLSGKITPKIDSYPAPRIMDISVEWLAGGYFRVTSHRSKLIMNHKSVFRLDSEGYMDRICIPDDFQNPIHKVVAATVLNPIEMVKFSDDAILLDSEEQAEVLYSSGEVMMHTNAVNYNCGSVAIIRCPWFPSRPHNFDRILEIIVRKQPSQYENVARFLESTLQLCKRRASGLFEDAQRQALEPWILDAAKQFYRSQPMRPSLNSVSGFAEPLPSTV